MWLINVDTLELEFHYQEGIKYAILSHVWGAEEVSFQEWKALCCNDIDVSAVLQKSGYHKILECCDQAKRDRFQFAWVDTCCIDKSSSAELSEAINSMFRWYGDSKACYVYLADVPPGTAISDPAFRASRWFTRGWTLQELLAPNNLGFFDADWNYLSDKSGNLHLLANITSIPPNCLNGNAGHTSVADRLSWASSRETTRPEDMAYCLLGILDVNMPLLYGEGGTKAFFRLQEEIIKTTDDETILSWGYKSAVGYAMSQVLASSPKAFARTEGTSIDIIRFAASAPFQMTNQGLQITLDVFEISSNVVTSTDATEGQQCGLSGWRPIFTDSGRQPGRIWQLREQ
ncbi:heterokaryon incompatibility protein-domain-containing protein [Podospora didyma]|uniref:Heterokaryon incompatibility protein-domain-containing protein n=1 Tax=Podospora didyma TaxID=330526 RepID=A0AAE0K0X4_9PEZI|nr:heterokaryon incompatibility protein-domain-containing protein [Podospora didyma]